MSHFIETVELLPSLARTATTTQSVQLNKNCKGIKVFTNVSVITGGATLTINVYGHDAYGNKYVIGTKAITSTTTTPWVLSVYPSLPASTGASYNDMLPSNYSVEAAHTDNKSITYSVSYDLIP
jgi:hypothetical protein